MELNFVAISGIVGALLPLIISFLKQTSWSTQVKRVFSFVLSIISAIVVTGASEGWAELSLNNLVTSFAVIFALAQTTYTGLWQDTSVEVAASNAFDRTAQ